MGSDWHLCNGLAKCTCRDEKSDDDDDNNHDETCPRHVKIVDCGSGFTATNHTFQMVHAMTMAILMWGAKHWNELTSWMTTNQQKQLALREWELWVSELRAYIVVAGLDEDFTFNIMSGPLKEIVQMPWWNKLPSFMQANTAQLKERREAVSFLDAVLGASSSGDKRQQQQQQIITSSRPKQRPRVDVSPQLNWQEMWNAYRLLNRDLCRWRWGVEMYYNSYNYDYRPLATPTRDPLTFRANTILFTNATRQQKQLHSLAPIPHAVLVCWKEYAQDQLELPVLLLIAQYAQSEEDIVIQENKWLTASKHVMGLRFPRYAQAPMEFARPCDCLEPIPMCRNHYLSMKVWEWDPFLPPNQINSDKPIVAPTWYPTLKATFPWLQGLLYAVDLACNSNRSTFMIPANVVSHFVLFLSNPVQEDMFDQCYMHWNREEWKEFVRFAAEHKLAITCY